MDSIFFAVADHDLVRHRRSPNASPGQTLRTLDAPVYVVERDRGWIAFLIHLVW